MATIKQTTTKTKNIVRNRKSAKIMSKNISNAIIKKCVVCHNETSSTMEVSEMMFGTRDSFNYRVCRHCGSLTIDDPPKNLNTYYPNNYYSHKKAKKSSKLKLLLQKVKDCHSLNKKTVLGHFLNLIFSEDSNMKAIGLCISNNKNPKILDIGSGTGHFLNKMDKCGFTKLYGIDPYLQQNIKIGNIKLKKAHIVDCVKSNKKYDIVMLSHVLEHLENPSQELENTKKLLNENGKIIIRIPISSSRAFEVFEKNWFQIDAPRHFFVPSLEGILALARTHNLKTDHFYFDSNDTQFVVSKKYSKGIPLINQSNPTIWNKIYYSIIAKKLNKSNKGDQATFIFSKTLDV